jgi:hypothetical protein
MQLKRIKIAKPWISRTTNLSFYSAVPCGAWPQYFRYNAYWTCYSVLQIFLRMNFIEKWHKNCISHFRCDIESPKHILEKKFRSYFLSWSHNLWDLRCVYSFLSCYFQNLSQQSDISDLLGGFKPTDARLICNPLYVEFKDLFCRSFSAKVRPSLGSHGVALYLKFFDLCYN